MPSGAVGMLHRKQKGAISLIEVLVALLVLTFGILGLAGMQLNSLRGNTSALVRTQAVELGYDLVDRMRANRNAAISGSYVADYEQPEEEEPNQTSGEQTQEPGVTPPPPTLAEQDIDEWKVLLAAFLPSGDGTVSTANGVATVTIRWDENWSDDADDDGFVYMTLQGEL